MLEGLKETLSQPVVVWVVWGLANVLDVVRFHELNKFVRGKLLGAII